MYSDFYGRVDGREYFGVEVIADRLRASVEDAERDFRQHTSKNGLFDGELRLEGTHTLTNAYPIHREVAELREWGVESFGRQGGFQYQPTARVSTMEAEAALPAAE